MSLSWRDRVSVWLGARRVCLSRTPRGLRSRPGAALRLDVTGETGWSAPIEALGRALPGYARAGAEVRVVLSNHFVRYVLVPGVDALSADDERIALARSQFQLHFGERATTWRLALAEEGSRWNGLAAAVEVELLDALLTTVASAGLTLRSVEPLLGAAFEACRHELGGTPAWLAVGERDRVCAARLEAGKWIEVRNARAPQGPGVHLAEILEQMRLTLGVDPGTVFIASDEPVEVDLRPGWKVRDIRLGGDGVQAEGKAA